MKLSEWEKSLLEFYLKNYNAKWVRVFNNKHPVLPTRVVFYTAFKRLVKKQPYIDELTYMGMYNKLNEGEWYLVTELLGNCKGE